MDGPDVQHDLDPRPPPEPPCVGKCRGDRPAWDAPSTLVNHNGRTLLVCTCCEHAMYAVGPVRPEDVPAGRLDPAVVLQGAVRFECRNCHYETVLAKEIVAK